MTIERMNRAMYLMYHFNNRNISSNEMNELQSLINEHKAEFDKRYRRRSTQTFILECTTPTQKFS